MSNLPFAHEVELEIGMIVFWDDRPGWVGRVVGLPTKDTLDVDYANGETDRGIARELFTTQPRTGVK